MAKRKTTEVVETQDEGTGGLVAALAGGTVDTPIIHEEELVEMAEEPKSVIRLLPENVIIDPRLRKLRGWGGGSKQEQSIAELSRLIVEDGQKQPVILWETPDGYVLVAGQRRREAVILARAEGEDVMLEGVVDPDITTFEQALRTALMENIQREDFTDIEFANDIRFVRETLGEEYKGKPGTAKVADYFGVSPGTITQKEKLLKLPEDVQADIQSGALTGAAALELVSVQEQVGAETAKEVKERAGEIAKKEAAGKVKKTKPGKAAPVQRTVPLTKEQAAIAKRVAEAAARDREKAAAEGAPVKTLAKHVRAASKAVAGDTLKTKAPKMGELCTVFDGLTGADQPKPMAKLAQAISEYGHGKIAAKKMVACWDDVAFMLPVEDEVAPKQKGKKAAGKKAGKKPGAKVAKKGKAKSKGR